MSQLPEITYIIVSYNTVDLLKNCLRSIENYGLFPAQVIVVDNASTDHSAAMVNREFPLADLVANKQNLGFPYAVNQGLQIARAPYIFILNGDIELTSNTVLGLLNHMENHPETAMAGPVQIKPDGTKILPVYPFPTLLREWLRNIFFADVWRYRLRGSHHLRQMKQVTEVDWLMGAALFVRREMVQQIGGMDDTVFMYGEELDWAYRATQNNWKVYFVPESVVIHHKSASADLAFDVHRYAVVSKSEYYFFAKHHGLSTLPFFVLARIVGSGLRMLASGFLMLFRVEEAKFQFKEHWLTILTSLDPDLYRWIHTSLKSVNEPVSK